MEPSDVTLLRQEIAFRGRIIEALLASNEALRERCAHLSSFVESKIELYSAPEKAAITKHLLYSTSNKGMTSNELLYSTRDLTVASNQSDYSTPDLGVTSNQSDCSTPDLGVTSNQLDYSTPQEGTTQNQSLLHNPQEGSGINEVFGPLPEKFEQKSKVVYLLASMLRQHLQYKGRESAMEAAAFVMLHIYNDGDGDYNALTQATGQSQSGLAKMIMRLKKKGMIQRTAFQKYALTETALNVLKQAWAKTPK